MRLFLILLLSLNLLAQCPPCNHQTTKLTVPFFEFSLPYKVKLELADFTLPVGLQSFATAKYKGEWLFIAGRTNGLHDVDNTDPDVNPFPISKQNTKIYVVDPTTGAFYSRSLYDSTSDLTQKEIDQLSATNTFYYQTRDEKTLYVIGGYGIDTTTGQMETKSSLTGIDVGKLIKWVKKSKSVNSAASCMRFTSHPLLQLTGGDMLQADPHQPFLLAFGQNFSGFYTTSKDGSYSYQIRPIQIIDDEKSIHVLPGKQPGQISEYRRRDLNVVPVIKKEGKGLKMAFSALSGVFTPYSDDNPGAWTTPININADGSSTMLDPHDRHAIKQSMNNYNCANVGLYSEESDTMYTLLFGGISAAIMSDGSNCNDDPDPQNNCCTAWLPASGSTFTSCCNLPFSNDITTISIDSKGKYRQYLMNEKYPTVFYTPVTCPGYTPPDDTHLWFGANSVFIPNDNLPTYPNGVIAFDKIDSATFIGYIVGGIASVITDTNCTTDSQASKYVFKVTLIPKTPTDIIPN